MKKILSVLFIVTLLTLLAGCGSDTHFDLKSNNYKEEDSVVVELYPSYYIEDDVVFYGFVSEDTIKFGLNTDVKGSVFEASYKVKEGQEIKLNDTLSDNKHYFKITIEKIQYENNSLTVSIVKVKK